MEVPRVGVPVRGSASGRPIMVVLDLLGRRGALRVVWELRSGPSTFRALQSAAEMNPSSLNTRVKELRSMGVVEHVRDGYRLTESGRSLLAALTPLRDWADAWAAQEHD